MATTDPVEIPIAIDTPLYTERIILDGQEYLIRFDWNDREQRWYFDLADINENPLASGIKIIANIPLLRRFTADGVPKGDLMAVDYSPENGEPPDFMALGRRVKLIYFPENSLG